MKINKIDAGIEQLDWAIKLFMNEEAYIPAIALAGAADGIFGELGKGAVLKQLCSNVTARTGEENNSVRQFINQTKNWFKHATRDNKSEIDIWDLKVQAIARINIVAASLIHIYPDYMSLSFIKFMQKVQAVHPECLPENGVDWLKAETVFINSEGHKK